MFMCMLLVDLCVIVQSSGVEVTCDLPFNPLPFKSEWSHLSDIGLADPGFGHPGRIDVLLGSDVFVALPRLVSHRR